MLDLESAICKEEALAYSFGERYKRLGEPVGDLPELEAEHKQYAEWLRELELYRETLIGRPCEVCKFHKTGSCSRWKCVFEEVSADEKQI